MFAFLIDNEHTFCYSLENDKRTNVQKGRKGELEMKKANKKYRIKSKFRFIMFVVIVLGIAAGTFGYITGLDVSTALEQPGKQITVEVTAGDTVWDIADQFKSSGKDIRKAVYEICQANDLHDGEIHTGMVLTIPEDL